MCSGPCTTMNIVGRLRRGTTRQDIDDLVEKSLVTTMYLANGNRLGLTRDGYEALAIGRSTTGVRVT